MCVCVCVFACGCVGVVTAIKRKTHDRNDLKLGSVVVLDAIDFAFKRLGSQVQG